MKKKGLLVRTFDTLITDEMFWAAFCDSRDVFTQLMK